MDSIDRYVRSFQKGAKERAGAVHPSTLGKCSRAAIYEYLGFEPDREWSDRELRVFAMGYRVEDFVADALEYAGELIARNVPLAGEYQGVRVVGEADLLLRVEGGWRIADVKSVHSNSFGYSSFPYEHHCYQVGAYEWLWEQVRALDDGALGRLAEELEPDDAPEGWGSWYVMLARNLRRGAYGAKLYPQISYVSKDDLRMEVSLLGAGVKEMALAEIDKLVGHIELGTIPDRPFQSPEEHRWLCARCIRKGYQKKDLTYSPGKEPLYEPKCRYFLRCWGIMPDQWNFWEGAVEYEAPW